MKWRVTFRSLPTLRPRSSRILAGFWVALILVGFPASALAAPQTYTEDFTTTTYKDDVNTTADWNTGDGELKLYPFIPSIIGNYDTPGSARDIAVEGDLAFVADMLNGLQVIDISDPANPVLVGNYDTPGWSWSVAVSGNHAFVADRNSGLQVIDISDPTNPVSAGVYDTPNYAYGVAIAGDMAYVANFTAGLIVIDVSDPTNPTLAGSYDTPGIAYNVAIAGDFAYVADDSSGLQVIDISDPTTPLLAGSYNTPGAAQGVDVAGDFAFVADASFGLQVFDISNPATPLLAGSVDTPGNAWGVEIWGDVAFVADYLNGLHEIDISDPANPVLIGTIDTPHAAYSVTVSGNIAYVADYNSGLQVVEIAEAKIPPQYVGSYEALRYCRVVAVEGDFAFLADVSDGMKVIDISDPTNPVLAGFSSAATEARGIAVSGDHAFVGNYLTGLLVFDISDPASPVLVGSEGTPGRARKLAVSGDHAYLVDDYDGLYIIDISDPTTPVIASNYNTPFLALDVAIAGDYAYVADGSSIQVIDIGDPTNPLLAGTFNTASWFNSIAVAGDLCFVTVRGIGGGSAGGLQIIDITDPTSPVHVGIVDTLDLVEYVAVSGDHAFVADWTYGLYMIDISNPTNPVVVGSFETPGSSDGVAVSGGHAFVADFDGGLQVIGVYDHELYRANKIGRSLTVDDATASILRARLTSTETSGIAWEVSADTGANWQAIVADGGWNEFTMPGDDLLWRSTHTWSPGLNPTVSDLTLDWLTDFGPIMSVNDIPNDQGKQVRVEWIRSGHDFVGDVTQIVEYAVYRKIDPGLGSNPEKRSEQLLATGLSAAARENAKMMLAAGWDFLVTVPVLVEDSYSVVVPTLADSTIVSGSYQTTFRVTALTATPGLFFHSPPDSGYSLDNLAPAVPASFAVAYITGSGNTLSWDESLDEDFQYFRVYRSTTPDFTPTPIDLVHSTTSAGWTDPEYDGGGVYYKVTATDFSGNESDAASTGIETGTQAGNGSLPSVFVAGPATPNPFNPVTEITYSIPVGATPSRVDVTVYTLQGRNVRTLVSADREPGIYSVTWDGTDHSGAAVASGVYLYRISWNGRHETKRMVLIR